MDKRQIKSLNKIYTAFQELILEKDYANVTIQDILDRSGVSRSTFYSHFSNKEGLLSSVCENIFDHVFSAQLTKEKDHDFSESSIFDYKHLITHTFYHFYDEQELIKAILISDGSSIFMNILRKRSSTLMEACVRSHTIYKDDVPIELQIYQLTESFVSILCYWVKNDCLDTPEVMTKYFFMLYNGEPQKQTIIHEHHHH